MLAPTIFNNLLCRGGILPALAPLIGELAKSGTSEPDFD